MERQKPIDAETARQIIDTYLSTDMTVRDIARERSLGETALYRLFQKAGIDLSQRQKEKLSLNKNVQLQIVELYRTEPITMEELAVKFKTSTNSVRKYLVAAGITRRDIKERIHETRAISQEIQNRIIELYNSSSLTIGDVAATVGVSHPIAKRCLEESGVTQKQINERARRIGSELRRGIEQHTTEEKRQMMKLAKKLYLEDDLSCSKVAERLGVSSNAVLRYLRKQDVDTATIRWQKLSRTNTGKKQSPETIAKQIAKRLGKKHSPETISRMKIAAIGKHSYTFQKFQEKHPFFCKVERVREAPETKVIQVTCKLCGDWFTPTTKQLYNRIYCLESDKTTSESNFYCSDECKGKCSVYRAKPTLKIKSRSDHFTPSDLTTWSKFVINRDKECLYCGVTENLHAHHIHPKSTHPKLALDPDNGITVCKKCHASLHTEECSASHLTALAC